MRPTPQLPRPWRCHVSRALFAFDDNFIVSMCFGASDAETSRMLVDALEAGRLEVEGSVQRSMRMSQWSDRADEFSVRLMGGSYVTIPPKDIEADVLDAEYGGADSPARPLIRQGMTQARTKAQTVITKRLEQQ